LRALRPITTSYTSLPIRRPGEAGATGCGPAAATRLPQWEVDESSETAHAWLNDHVPRGRTRWSLACMTPTGTLPVTAADGQRRTMMCCWQRGLFARLVRL
jgi:hypothetical protein